MTAAVYRNDFVQRRRPQVNRLGFDCTRGKRSFQYLLVICKFKNVRLMMTMTR